MKLFLVRHGEKDGEGFDAGLTELGREQMEGLGERLQLLSVNVIYCSSNARSIESANIVAKYLAKPIIVVKGLSEFDRSFFSLNRSDATKDDQRNYQELITFIRGLQLKSEDALLVMNAGINRAIICHLMGIPVWKGIHFKQDYAGVSELELKELYGRRLWSLNATNRVYGRHYRTEDRSCRKRKHWKNHNCRTSAETFRNTTSQRG